MKARHNAKSILTDLAHCLGVTEDDLLSHCRKAELVDCRSMIVAVLMEHAHLRQQDVAPLLDISQAAVSKLLTRHRQLIKHPGGNPDYQKRYADFLSVTASDCHFACPTVKGGAQLAEESDCRFASLRGGTTKQTSDEVTQKIEASTSNET